MHKPNRGLSHINDPGGCIEAHAISPTKTVNTTKHPVLHQGIEFSMIYGYGHEEWEPDETDT